MSPTTRNAPAATEALNPTTTESVSPRTLEEVVEIFKSNLYMPDPTALYAVMGAVAANQLDGDPVWLLLVGPPSSGKTELLASMNGLPAVHEAATLTEGALLSGVAQREHTADAKGGLLREIDEYGIVLAKDFGSVLSMNRDTRTQLLAALREVYDGRWTRRVGVDGGRKLHWEGKVGLLGGCTPAFDQHHSVIAAMGDRFLLCRLGGATEDQEGKRTRSKQLISQALSGSGDEKQLRRKLSEAVTGLFASIDGCAAKKIAAAEVEYLGDLAILVVHSRSAVMRDGTQREIAAVPQSEAPARIVKQLERLLAGLDKIGLDRETALRTVTKVALDSMPAIRLKVLDALYLLGDETPTTDLAESTGLPSTATRRTLEDLTAHHVVTRKSQGQGKPDLWSLESWPRESYAQAACVLDGVTFPEMSEGAQTDLSRNVSPPSNGLDPTDPYPKPVTGDISGTPPYESNNGTLPIAKGFNGAKPQSVSWNPEEQMAALDDYYNREG
jgi:DNA-binding transcriptional ArsR family regulator